MKTHTSEFLFKLADKYGIQYKTSHSSTLDDNSYDSFCNEYHHMCSKRDAELKRHLAEQPNLFRTFIPWREGVFSTVLELQWYYDEILVYDPVYFELVYFNSKNIAEKKSRLCQVLYYLNFLRDSITEGFLLLASYDSIAQESQASAMNFGSLLSSPEIREECDRLVQVYKMEGAEGINQGYYNVRCNYRGQQTLFPVVKDFEKIKSEMGYGIYFDLVGSNYTAMTIDEVRSEGIYDKVFGGYLEEYQNEIKFILGDIDTGAAINTPVLFERKLDELVLKAVSNETNVAPENNEHYQLFLPFTQGIPPEKLFELRMKMPSAFIDFRRALFEIIHDARKEELELPVLKLKIERKVNPIVKSLDVEIKNALTKARILGAGAFVSGLGTFGLWHYGIDPDKFQSILTDGLGVLSGFSGLATHITKRRTNRSNDFYFLWKAQQLRK